MDGSTELNLEENILLFVTFPLQILLHLKVCNTVILKAVRKDCNFNAEHLQVQCKCLIETQRKRGHMNTKSSRATVCSNGQVIMLVHIVFQVCTRVSDSLQVLPCFRRLVLWGHDVRTHHLL